MLLTHPVKKILLNKGQRHGAIEEGRSQLRHREINPKNSLFNQTKRSFQQKNLEELKEQNQFQTIQRSNKFTSLRTPYKQMIPVARQSNFSLSQRPVF